MSQRSRIVLAFVFSVFVLVESGCSSLNKSQLNTRNNENVIAGDLCSQFSVDRIFEAGMPKVFPLLYVVFGNKVDSIAIGGGVGAFRNSGLVIDGCIYFRNFFINVMFYDFLLPPESPLGGWGIFGGYSLYFKSLQKASVSKTE